MEIGERQIGRKPGRTLKGTEWVLVDKKKTETKIYNIWELQKMKEVRTFESNIEEMPFLIPPEVKGLDKPEEPKSITWIQHVSEALDRQKDAKDK